MYLYITMSKRFSFGNMDETENIEDYNHKHEIRKAKKCKSPKITPLEKKPFWRFFFCDLFKKK
jgi:hypothetical protein